MSVCSRCNGEGYEVYEDGRMVRDACYHCGNTGEVAEDTAWHDRLQSVASSLAYHAELEYRKEVNSDPDGDGYALGAAENMMSARDYFMSRVYDREYETLEELFKLNQTLQKVLVAWNELPLEKSWAFNGNRLPSPNGGDSVDVSEDDIPF